MSRELSVWWIGKRLAFNVYQRLGWYFSLGVNITLGRKWCVQLHLLFWIVQVLSAQEGKELKELEAPYFVWQEEGEACELSSAES